MFIGEIHHSVVAVVALVVLLHRQQAPMMVCKRTSSCILTLSKCLISESDMESVTTSNSLNRFSFDVRSVFDDEHRRLVKKYRETKKKAKLLFRRQADQGERELFIFATSIAQSLHFFLEILTLLDSFLSSNESKLTLINELIYECQRLYPAFEPRLVQYKMTIFTDSTGQDDDQPSSSSPSSIILDDYM